jgi:hypothetical protein
LGAGAVSVRIMVIPCALAPATSASSWSHVPAGYAFGSEASKSGFVRLAGRGAKFFQ